MCVLKHMIISFFANALGDDSFGGTPGAPSDDIYPPCCSASAQAPLVAMIHPPKIDPGKGWYSIDEGVIALNKKRRRCSPCTTVTS